MKEFISINPYIKPPKKQKNPSYITLDKKHRLEAELNNISRRIYRYLSGIHLHYTILFGKTPTPNATCYVPILDVCFTFLDSKEDAEMFHNFCYCHGIYSELYDDGIAL